MSKSTLLRLYLLAFVIGGFLGRDSEYLKISVLGFLIFLIICFQIKNRKLKIVCISFLVLLTGFIYGQLRHYLIEKNNKLTHFYNQEVVITGIIKIFPEIKEKNHKVIIFTEKLVRNNTEIVINENLLLNLNNKIILKRGDRVEILGKIQKPQKINGFDYALYLKKKNVQSFIKNPKEIKIISQNNLSLFFKTCQKIRTKLSQILQENIPPPQNKIAMGILLGIKDFIPKNVIENFKKSGLQHLLVASGSNVMVIVCFLIYFLKPYGRVVLLIGTIIGLIIFMGITGGDTAVVRACIMGIGGAFALFLGRFSDIRNLILFMLAVMIIYNPLIIQYDIGFFLSFFATLGIIFITPLIINKIQFITPKFGIRMMIAVSFSAQLAVLPIIGYYFEEFPLIGIITNLLTEPLVPLGMFFSFVIIIFSFLPKFLLKIISIPAFIVLELLLIIAKIFANFPLLECPKILSLITWWGITIFFIWAHFSEYYFQKIQETLEQELDFSSTKNKNKNQ